jgi:hypothetical protein
MGTGGAVAIEEHMTVLSRLFLLIRPKSLTPNELAIPAYSCSFDPSYCVGIC